MLNKHTIVAGTFNCFHIGHEKLINAALSTGEKVTIGIMSDEYVLENKKVAVPYNVRQRAVLSYILNNNIDIKRISLIKLNDTVGDALINPDYDSIAVSSETENNAKILNFNREKAGLNPLKIVVVDISLDDKGKKISSTRILDGETDRNGKCTDSMSIRMLGTSGGMSSPDRASAGIFIEYDDVTILLDCGDMTSVQILKADIKAVKLDAIFITHGHIDHYIGLPMLVMHHMMLQHRSKPLFIYAPEEVIFDLKPIFDNYAISLPFSVYFIKIHDGASFKIRKLDVKAFEVVHSMGNCYGYTVINDINQKIVYSGDTGPCDNISNEAKNADILIHEATFASDFSDKLFGHCTVKDAIRIGTNTNVKKLILTHISLRYHKDMQKYMEDMESNAIPAEVGEDLKRYVI